MSEVEELLRKDFPDATNAEITRFVKACSNGKKGADAVKEEAEKLLEEYLDWRVCYGLNNKDAGSRGGVSSDSSDWKYAIEKTVEISASMKEAEEMAKRLEEEAKKSTPEEKQKVDYDMDFSDSQDNDAKNTEVETEKDEDKDASTVTGSEKEATDSKIDITAGSEDLDDNEKKKMLSQIIFLHKDKEGLPIQDREGHKILHVIPGMIDRRVAQADFYAMVLSFYLDRKLDRDSEEKVTIVLDVRPGDGWPNTPAVMMIRFVQAITKILQKRFPERLHSLVIFPVPWGALSIWRAMKRVFRYGLADKVVLVAGRPGRDDPLPKQELELRIDGAVLDLTEQCRMDNFKPIGSL